MATEQDPFTQVYHALWRMLEAHKGFTGLVRIGNRIKLSGSRPDPTKQLPAAADLPEVRVIPAGGAPHIQRTSDSGSVVKRFEIQLNTGQVRVDQEGTDSLGAAIFPIEWELLRAMHGWQRVLGVLTWNGKTFVKLMRPGKIEERLHESGDKHGLRGWSAIWACDVEMWFTTVDLAPVTEA